jgi:L-lactate dehydrogenase complex protein LldG
MAVEAGGPWSAFTAKAEVLGAAVMRTPSDETAAALLREMTGSYAGTRSLTRKFPRVAQAAADAASEPAAEVVAPAEFAIAETGSVALNEPADDRSRCFLAERLWLLVPEAGLVPNLETGLQRIGDLIRGGAVHPLLMSGPSRTADIERVLTIGVHGPRSLVIVIVGAAPRA